MKKILAVAAIGIAVMSSALLAPAAANAADNPLPPAFQEQLQTFWTKWGVPASTQDALVAKLENGQKTDNATGAAPATSKTTAVGDTTTTIDTFADGSINVGTVGPVAPTGMLQPNTAGGTSCHQTSSSGNSNSYSCKLSMDLGFLAMNYTGNYSTFATAADRITSVSSLTWNCAAPCTASITQPHIIRAVDQPSLSALAEADMNFSGVPIYGSGNEWLRFFEHNGVPSSQYN